MKISVEYLPIAEIAPKLKDTTRPMLSHLLVRRTDDKGSGELVASDGFVLAVVPVTLDPDDVPGLICREAFKQAARLGARTRGDGHRFLILTQEAVVAPTGASFPRIASPELAIDGAYPDYHRIVPRHVHTTPPEPGMGEHLAFNHKLLGRVADALGGSGVVVWPNPKARQSAPMVLTPVGGGSGGGGRFLPDGMPAAPYGVVMPMHVARPVAAPAPTPAKEQAA